MYKPSDYERKTMKPGIRFRPSVYDKLRQLAKHDENSIAGYIEKFINEEYTKIKGVQ